MGFINTFCTPIANSSIGYKYIYIFVGWDIVESFLWWLFWFVPFAPFTLPRLSLT
jgi:hypothetical protein